MYMLTEVFWTFLISSGSAIIVLAIKSCLKANIDELSFCGGLFKVHRVIRLDDIQSGNAGSDDEGSGASLRLTPSNQINKPPDIKL
jgi:hypothetical protein